jgi:hypothetical protein
MTLDDFPSGARDLIQRALASMDHVETLLLLYGQPARDFTVRQVAERVRLTESVAAQVLERLTAADLATCTDSGFRFRSSLAHNDAVEQLAREYHARPVTLVQAIYSRTTPVTSFTDAFRPRDAEQR